MSFVTLLFTTLSRFVITFHPKSKHLLISWLQSPSAVISEPKKLKSVSVSIVSPSIGHDVMEPEAMILVFWMLSFKPAFSLLFQKSSSRGSLILLHFLPLEYVKFLIFLLVILTPGYASFSLAFCMMYSAYKLNKQGNNIHPLCILFPIFPCLVLTVASWPEYRFLWRQVRWSDIPISLRIFHSLLCSTLSKSLALSMKQK